MLLLLLVTDMQPSLTYQAWIYQEMWVETRKTVQQCCVVYFLVYCQISLLPLWTDKGFLVFYLCADTCAPDYMSQDNNNKELQHLNACTFSALLATGHEEENNWRCWKWFLLLRPRELKTIIKLVAESNSLNEVFSHCLRRKIERFFLSPVLKMFMLFLVWQRHKLHDFGCNNIWNLLCQQECRH